MSPRRLHGEASAQPALDRDYRDLLSGRSRARRLMGIAQEIFIDQNEGWFTLLRPYALLKPILDKTWRWNDIERVN